MLQPLGKRLIVQPIVEDTKILIANPKPSRYTVLAIGDEIKNINVNDIIYLSKHAGVEIEFNDQKYIAVDDFQVLAKITP